MRETGIEWIGAIPEHWSIRKIDQMYKERRTKVSDRDFPPLSVTMKGVVPQLATAAKTDAHDDRKLVCKGDFAINSRSDRRGSCGIAPMDGSVSLINTILCPKNETNPEYLNWLFHTSLFADEFYRWGHGIVDDLWTTNWTDMKKISIPFPPLPEQSRIAAFLDERCAKIDEAIAKHKALIEKLDEYRKAVITRAVTKGVRGEREMKESGFERIGLIPSEWYYRPLKSIGRFYGGMSGKAGDDFKVEDGEVFTYFIPYTNIFNNFEVNPSILAKVKIKEGETQNCVHKGDLLFLMSSEDYAGLGQTSVMLYEIDNLWLNSFCKGLTNKSTDVDSKYLNYFLSSELIHDYIRVKGEGYTRINLKTSNLGMCPVFVPTPEEQSEIVAFLDKKCAAIDSAKERHAQLIAKLEEYKKSLIYNAVTGKIEC